MAKTDTRLRKVPTQDRSRRRLESIIDAAAQLFADQGFDATTIEAIAAAAETSVGSVYQFFPNKLAIFHGVSDRCRASVRTAYTALVGTNPVARDVGQLIDAVVDGFFALQESDPSFRAVWSNTQLIGEIAEDDLILEREIVGATAALLASFAKAVERKRLETIAIVMVQTVSAGLFLILREDVAERRAELIEELKRMLRAYARTLADG